MSVFFVSFLSLILFVQASYVCDAETNGECVKKPFSCEERTQGWLSRDNAMEGFHVLCVVKGDEEGTVGVTVFKNGLFEPKSSFVAKNLLDVRSLRSELETSLPIPPPRNQIYQQQWAIFTEHGERIETYERAMEIAASDHLWFIFEGGQWIWPGVEIGHTFTISLTNSSKDVNEFVIKTISIKPLVFSVENFLKQEECDTVIQSAKDKVKPSDVVLQDQDKGKPASTWRTSTSCFLTSTEVPLFKEIDHRVEQLVRVPRQHQELIQVIRYELTQHYDAHTDYFDPQYHANDPRLLKEYDYGYANRMATVFWYMSNVTAGGETVFPRFGGTPQPDNYKDCTKGLLVKPIKGKVIIFYSMLPNGVLDPHSLHGGCPVIEGIKWAANKWVWNKRRGDIA